MAQRFARDHTIGVLLNLDASSETANTVPWRKGRAVEPCPSEVSLFKVAWLRLARSDFPCRMCPKHTRSPESEDGVRVSPPQKLPAALVGKPLFPHVSFKNVTLHVNFGTPTALLGDFEGGALSSGRCPSNAAPLQTSQSLMVWRTWQSPRKPTFDIQLGSVRGWEV